MAGTLTNDGVIRKSRFVSGSGALSLGVGADVTTVQDVAGRWGMSAGGPGFDPLFDMDRNSVIDIRDVMLVTSLWNAGG